MKKLDLIVVSMLVFGVASASDFNAPDLGKLSPEKVKVYKAGAIPLVVEKCRIGGLRAWLMPFGYVIICVDKKSPNLQSAD